MPVLQSDSSLRLPNLTVLKASAGSGKTYALTQRYAQFLLSGRIPRNDLRNVLAITFSDNAARDMREKVLEWLKKLASSRDTGRLAAMAKVTDGTAGALALRAEEILETILSRYSDFQVVTIDSFMSAVFRASAIDFGYSSEFEIVLEPRPIVEYAFSLFLRGAQEGTPRAALLDSTIRSVLGMKGSADSFPWESHGAPAQGDAEDRGAPGAPAVRADSGGQHARPAGGGARRAGRPRGGGPAGGDLGPGAAQGLDISPHPVQCPGGTHPGPRRGRHEDLPGEQAEKEGCRGAGGIRKDPGGLGGRTGPGPPSHGALGPGVLRTLPPPVLRADRHRGCREEITWHRLHR